MGDLVVASCFVDGLDVNAQDLGDLGGSQGSDLMVIRHLWKVAERGLRCQLVCGRAYHRMGGGSIGIYFFFFFRWPGPVTTTVRQEPAVPWAPIPLVNEPLVP